ncbi:MAG TPA: aromatic amino acid ammonia-lyase [Bryobacteraceae bacterium]|nr:aromatic amino acid ammonia-lyase [Bryobacteraceae bacterium]
MATLSTPTATVLISQDHLSLNDIVAVARHWQEVALSTDDDFVLRIRRSREALERKLAAGEVVYGVNTGFGGNARYVIPSEELAHHQQNLLEFLSCGVGEPLPEEAVRAAILLRANALARGLSAVRLVVIERLLDLLNHRITPVVPRFGSVGASGDLCPSAYITRVMAGRGEALYKGCRVPAAEALHNEGIPQLDLAAKEGLALLNGTTVMTGAGAIVVDEAAYLFKLSLGALAMAAEALGSSPDYYHPAIHMAKHHPGQLAVAEMLNSLLFDSKLVVPLDDIRGRVREANRRANGSHDVAAATESIQSPYSLRCAPQGLGPMQESLEQCRTVIEREANSVNDNPLIDGAAEQVYHTGNFYGAHVARAMDGLKLDLANLANWLHSLMALLMDDRFSNGLPPSLSPHPGLYQGFKGMQIVHTSLVTAIRHWCAPSLIHTLPTEQFNQDIVSLGTHAALTAMDVTGLLRNAVAITLLAAAQAIDLRDGGGRMGAGTRPVYRAIRAVSGFVEADRALDRDIAAVNGLIARREIPALRN